MLNYMKKDTTEFTFPPRIKFGNDSAKELGKEVLSLKLNSGKVMILTDQNMIDVGLADKIIYPLKNEGLEVWVETKKNNEPLMEEVLQLIEKVRKNKPSLIIGFGGGSSMDTAKVVSLMATNPGNLDDYLSPNTKTYSEDGIPLILIPTTSGTGSEVSNCAVINDGDFKRGTKGSRTRANLTLIDPKLTITLPPRLTAATGIDALSHAAEAVLSKQSTPLSDSLGLKAIELIAKNLRVACKDGENIEARWNMSFAAMLGGLVISLPGVSSILVHCISEGISARYKIPHGESCAMILPYVYNFNLDYAEEKLSDIAHAMGCNTYGISKKEAAKKAITETFKLLDDINLPTTFSEVGVPEEDLYELAKYIAEKRQHEYDQGNRNPRPITFENTHELFKRIYKGNRN